MAESDEASVTIRDTDEERLTRSASEGSVSSTGKPRKSLLKKTTSPAVVVDEEGEVVEDPPKPPPDPDKPRKGLQWNISQMTWTEELRQIREEIQRRKMEAPGKKMLLSIPKERFHHWQFNYADMTYYPYGLDLSNMNVQDIQVITTLKHLTFLDLSHNNMKNDSLAVLEELKYLSYLNLDHNELVSMDIPGSANIRWFSIRHNNLAWIEPFTMPMIEYAHLDNNMIKFIENFDEENTPLIRLLSMRGNRLVTGKDCFLSKSVKYLYLGDNKLRNMTGLDHLANLRVLHLRNNKIKKLSSIALSECKNLYYLNLRDNFISNVRQFKKLRTLTKLRVVITTGNPFEKENPEKARLGVIYCLLYLKRVNKNEVTADDIDSAKELREEIEPDEESSEDDVPEETNEYTDDPPDEDEMKKLENTTEGQPVETGPSGVKEPGVEPQQLASSSAESTASTE